MRRKTVVMLLAIGASWVSASPPLPDLAVLPAEIRGVVLFPDGNTPVKKLRLQVWNAQTEEIVYNTETDKDGVFSVPRLTEGNHYVTVGPVRIDMRILADRAGVTTQPYSVVVILPKRLPMIPVLIAGAAAVAALPLVVSP